MNKSQKIRLGYGIFLTVMAVAVGVAFIVAVSQVYYGGIAENPDYPFEITRISEHILLPFVLLVVFVAAVIGGFVLTIFFPVAEKRAAIKDNAAIFNKLKTRVPTTGNEDYDKAVVALRKRSVARICIWSVALAVFLAAGIAILVYAFDMTNYHTNALKNDMLEFAKNVLVWTVAAVVVGIAAVVADSILLKSSVRCAKSAIVAGDKNALPQPQSPSKGTVIVATVVASVVALVAIVAYVVAPIVIHGAFSWSQNVIYAVVFVIAALIVAGIILYNVYKHKIPEKVNKICLIVARVSVAVIAVTFIIVGALNGGANDVLVKAINICTECIGLG